MAQPPPPPGYAPPQPGYAPPQPGYAPLQPVPVYTGAVVVAPIVMPVRLGKHPVNMQCPQCQAQIVTGVRYQTGMMTWLLAGGICLLLPFGCCFIPFCVDACKDTVHNCPNCQCYVGTFSH